MPAFLDLINNLIDKVSGEAVSSDDNKLDSVIQDISDFRINKNPKEFYDLVTSIIDIQKKQNNGNNVSELEKLIEEPNMEILAESRDRASLYNNYESIREKIPWAKKALSVLISNIISPDDITKHSLLVKDEDNLDELNVNLKLAKNIIDKIKLEDKQEEIVFETLLFGDKYVEIVDVDKTLGKFKLLKEDSIPSSMRKKFAKFIKSKPIDLEYKNEKDEKISKTINLRLINFEKSKIILSEQFNILTDLNFNQEETDNQATFIDNSIKSEEELEKIKSKRNFDSFYLKYHKPHNVVKLGDDDFCYGYIIIDTDGDVNIGRNQNKVRNKKFIKNVIEYIKQNIDYNFIKQRNDLKQILARVLNSVNLDEDFKTIDVRYVPPGSIQHFKKFSSKYNPYGESIFDTLKFNAKLYIALSTCLLNNRLNNSTEKREIAIDIGMNRDAAKFFQSVQSKMRRNQYNMDQFANLDSIPSLIPCFHDYFIPMKDGKKYFEIGDIPPRNDTSRAVEELKLIRDAIVSDLDVPPPYLNIEENSESKSTLTQENVIFAVTILGWQKVFSIHFTELITKIMLLLGTDTTTIKVTLNPPVTLKNEKELEYLNTVTGIVESLTQLGIPTEMILEKYVYPFFPEDKLDEIKREQKISEEERKEAGAWKEEDSKSKKDVENPEEGGEEMGGEMGELPQENTEETGGDTGIESPEETPQPEEELPPPPTK